MRILKVIPDRLSSVGKYVISDNSKKSLTRQLFLLNFRINVVLVIHMLFLIILFDVTCLQKKPLYVVLTTLGLVAISSIALIYLLCRRYVISKKKNEVDFEVMSSDIESLRSLPQEYESFENLLNATDYLEKKNRLESIKQEDLLTNNGVNNIADLGVKIEKNIQDLMKHYRHRMLEVCRELKDIESDISRVTKLPISDPNFFTRNEETLKVLLETRKLISKQRYEIDILAKSYYERILTIITTVIRMIKSSQENDVSSLFDKDSSTLKELNAVLIKAESMFQKLNKQEVKCPSFEELYSIVCFIKSFISSTLYIPKKDMVEEVESVVKEKAKQIQKVMKSIFSAFNDHDHDVVNQENDETLLKKNISEKDTVLVAQLLKLQDVMLKLCFVQLERLHSISTASSIDCDINVATSDVVVGRLQNVSFYDTLSK
ncbi:hypothetical protein [Ehrlichia japonica]|uniref:Uncharacterized protein n=1 Tax=Ehrlichia japonica TaxID=391036 RepID=X5H3A0_9RICK|nr:hypothetical protein [Ehrlichia japonica]AHX04545.1 hypothetical protein EHF_0905 [Ehrlichia japonica]